MLSSSVPTKLSTPFASGAGTGFIRTIPAASQIGITPGAASLVDGFPPVCFQPPASGGVPPSGADFNGVLNALSAWTVWKGAGGSVQYDAALATAIGGYPKGAMLGSANSAGLFWINTVESNTTSPDAGGAGWVPLAATVTNYVIAAGTANALTATAPSVPTTVVAGTRIALAASATSTGAVTLNLNGAGATAVVYNLTPLAAGALLSGQVYEMIFDGARWQMLSAPSATASTYSPGNPGYEIFSNGKIEQWGTVINEASFEGYQTFSFPTPFLTSCDAFTFATINIAGGGQSAPAYHDAMAQLGTTTRTTFQVFYQNASGGDPVDGFSWIAKGR